MVGHPRRTAIAAVFAAALALPLLAPPGIAGVPRTPEDFAQGAPVVQTQTQPWIQTFSLWGPATGAHGSINGATVTACQSPMPLGAADPQWPGGCKSATVWGGVWMIEDLWPGTYTIQISVGDGYGTGFLSVGAPGNFTRNINNATTETVGPSHQVAGMTVPVKAAPPVPPVPPIPPTPSWGSISGQVLVFYPYWYWPHVGVTTSSVPVVVENGGAWPVTGGTVTACPTGNFNPWPWPWGSANSTEANGSWQPAPNWGCRSSNVDMAGRYWIGDLLNGASYTVGISTGFGPVPPGPTPFNVDPQHHQPGWWYPMGWYSNSAPGHFTTSFANATPVWVWGPVQLPAIIVNWGWRPPAPTSAAVSGTVVGLSAGALAGGVVSACNTSTWVCSSTSIQSTGAWSFASLPNATYRVAVAPPTGANYPSGFYANGSTGNFTVNSASATFITVAGAAVTVPTITVPVVIVTTIPPDVGSINTGPATVVVVSWARPYNSLSTTTAVRVRKGQTAEVVACVGKNLVGTTVEIWRKYPGQSWTFVTTRKVSASGCSRFIFTPTKTASYRFRVPGSTMAIAAWGPARNVIVVK